MSAVERSNVQVETINPERTSEVAEWEKRIVALNLVVGDLDRSTSFYSQVFGSSRTSTPYAPSWINTESR